MGPGSPTQQTVGSLDDRLLDQRIVVLGQEIDDDVARLVCGRLVLLAAENRRHDITLYVSSSGGSPAAAAAIHDTMRWVEPDVLTIVHGTVTGAGLLVAAAGAKGRRTALPHARFQLTPPPGGLGVTTDARGRSEELTRQRREITELIAAYSGHTATEVAADTERGRWFGATEALGYGLVDRVAGIDTADSDT